MNRCDNFGEGCCGYISAGELGDGGVMRGWPFCARGWLVFLVLSVDCCIFRLLIDWLGVGMISLVCGLKISIIVQAHENLFSLEMNELTADENMRLIRFCLANLGKVKRVK